MTLTLWLAYAAMAALNIISPGPAVLLAISNRIRFGSSSVYLSSLGNVLGLFVLAGGATLGLGAVVKNSALLFMSVKILGAAYLIYLGIKQWRSKHNIFHPPIPEDELDATIPDALNRTAFFKSGFVLAITNPKPLLFFAALYPQFMNFHAPLMPKFLIMTITFMAISFVSLLTYASLTGKAMGWFTQGKRASYFNQGSGAAFIFLGISMLFLKRPNT